MMVLDPENERPKVWPAARVFVGGKALEGRVRAMLGDERNQSEIIAAADGFKRSTEFDGLWELFGKGHFLGYVHETTMMQPENLALMRAAARARVERIVDLEQEPADWKRDAFLMAVGAVILYACVFLSRWLR